MTQFYNEYSKVLVSVDCIIFGFDGSNLQVLIGKRKMDPGRGEWSLYGGFVGATENLEDAANRVILELTGMKNLYIRQVGAFGRIDRDPGERVISIAYCTLINVKDYDDSLRVEQGLEWVSLNELPELYSDHKLMIRNAIAQIRRRINHEPLSFKLLPDLFTLTQLQHVFEAVIGEEIDKRNFRKRVKDIDFIEKTELIDKVNSKRGAALYRFNKKAYEEDPSFNLVLFTWGNVSGIDREKGLVVIKPSGVDYDTMKASDMVVVDLETGKVVEGDLNPSSDTPTHLVLYRAFPELGGVVHTHSTYATAWAQAGLDIPNIGTTHADYFHDCIPCTDAMTEDMMAEYEHNTGVVIVDRFKKDNINPVHTPGVLVKNHGPFTWGKDADQAVYHAVVAEQVAKMAFISFSVNPNTTMNPLLVEKHFNRKHGPNAYYGQKKH